MSTRKKIVLALGSLCLAVIVALAAVIAVLATANLTVNSQIGATYTAKDVNVVVGGEYALKGDAFTSMGESITFQTSESLQTKKLGLSGVRLTKETPFVVLKYSFKNLSTENNVGISTTVTQGSDSNNVTVNVAYSKTAITPTLYSNVAGKKLNDAVLGGNETAYVYVKIAVSDATQPAAFQGSIKFDLTRSSGDSTADQGLLKVGIGEVTTYGEYPQTFVGATLNTTLVAELAKGSSSALKATGKTYHTDSNGTTIECKEYTYNGQKYALIDSANIFANCEGTFSTGDSLDAYKGQKMFFKVEPIQFKVIDYDGENTVTIVSEYVLGSKPYNSNNNSWKGSALDTFFNDQFLKESKLEYSSSDPQQEFALQTTIKNNITGNMTDGSGESSSDKIWLPSINDLQVWYSDKSINAGSTFSILRRKVTDFAVASYAYISWGYGWQYLRSAGSSSDHVCTIDSYGYISATSPYTGASDGYFPALKVNINRM